MLRRERRERAAVRIQAGEEGRGGVGGWVAGWVGEREGGGGGGGGGGGREGGGGGGGGEGGERRRRRRRELYVTPKLAP